MFVPSGGYNFAKTIGSESGTELLHERRYVDDGRIVARHVRERG